MSDGASLRILDGASNRDGRRSRRAGRVSGSDSGSPALGSCRPGPSVSPTVGGTGRRREATTEPENLSRSKVRPTRSRTQAGRPGESGSAHQLYLGS